MKKTVLNLFVALLVFVVAACFDKKEQSETRPAENKGYTFKDSTLHYSIVKVKREDCNSTYWQNLWFHRTELIWCGNDIFYYRPVDLSDFAQKYTYVPKENDWLKIRYKRLNTDSAACNLLKYIYEDIYLVDYQVIGNYIDSPGTDLVKGRAVKTACNSLFGNNIAFEVEIPVNRENEFFIEKRLFYPDFLPADFSETIQEGDEYSFNYTIYNSKTDCNDGNKAYLGYFFNMKKN